MATQEKKEEATTAPKSTRKTAQTAKAERTYSEADVKKLIAEAVAEATANVKPRQTVVLAPEEKVTLLFLGGIAKGTHVNLGILGRINRDGGTIDVPKKAFLENLTGVVEHLLLERKLIVVNGLTDEERERFGIKYKDTELLSAKAYARLLDFSIAELKNIYSTLCDEHKALVFRIFNSAYVESSDNRVTVEKIKTLHEIDKEANGKSPYAELLETLMKKTI